MKRNYKKLSKRRKILVTGGAGFIGSHLAEAHLFAGDQVHVFDNLSTGSLANVKSLKRYSHFKVTVSDIMDEKQVSHAIREADYVYHLAAAVGVKRIMENPVETILTNVRGTENILLAANQHQKKVLIASTSEVYGKAMALKKCGQSLAESDDWTLGPTTKRRWAYACSKAMDEFLARAFYEEKNLRVILIRLFNTVGARQTSRYGMVIPTFVQAALRHEPILVHGNGAQTRSFTHVEDAVRAMMLLMNCPGAIGEVFNIGSGETISILKLAKKIKQATQSRSQIIKIPYEKIYPHGFEDMQARTPNIKKLNQITGYTPKKNLNHIIEDVISYSLKGD